jgi:hypothetical protein
MSCPICRGRYGWWDENRVLIWDEQMTQKQLTTCPICGENYVRESRSLLSGTIERYFCERCGSFDIDHQLSNLGKKPWNEVRHLVSGWIRKENKAGVTNPIVAGGASFAEITSPEWWSEQFEHLGFPSTTSEKLNALLMAYGESAKGIYDATVSFTPSLTAEIAAKDLTEVAGLSSLLSQLGYLTRINPLVYEINAKGWLRIEELHNKLSNSNSGFVAMWFNEITTNYRKAVIAAIDHCGYKPIIVDQQEFNDFVMNQVISSIRESRFLIADFTARPEIDDGKVKNGVRGGVYWEAGMAYGIGIPVIHTCEDSPESRNRIHFDVNQYNTMFWKQEELGSDIRSLDQTRINPNFTEKLTARILATIGRGNNPS